MEIAVIGLGLIGGSICKAIKKNTNHIIYGFDIERKVIDAALETSVINETLNDKDLNKADITFVCLYPMETITYIKNNIGNFKKGSIVCDVCGIKKYITDELEDILNHSGLKYIGTHPMAGKEFSGYEYSDEKIFEKASFIIAKTPNSSKDEIIKAVNGKDQPKTDSSDYIKKPEKVEDDLFIDDTDDWSTVPAFLRRNKK